MKRLISLLICVLLLGSVSTAYAAGNTALQILGYQQNADKLDIILYAKSDTIITTDHISARLEDTALPVDRLSSLSDSEYGTSWIVVLEPAPSKNVTDMDCALVESIVNQLGPKDNLAVLDASTREMTSFVRDIPTIKAFVKAAAAQSSSGGYVKLYDAINTAFTEFKSNTELNPHKCLLLVSGCVDTNSTCSFKELLRQVENSPITVYTVGITRGIYPYTDSFEAVRALSDTVPSGLAFAMESFPSSAGADAAITILDNEKKCVVLTVDLSEMNAPMTGTLCVSLNSHDASMASVSVTPLVSPSPCPHEWGDDATCQHARTCIKCGMTDPDGAPADHKDDGTGHCEWCGIPIQHTLIEKIMNWIKQNMIAAVMGGILFILLIVLLVVLIKKKSGGGDIVIEDPPIPPSPLSKVTVELTKRTTGERFTGEIMDSTIRAGLESPLKLSGDPAISRKHMEFIWQNGILYVQDTNSKNGTYVNGEKIERAVALNQNDIIHAGESDFYVTWRSNS